MSGLDHQPSALNLPCQFPAEPLQPAHRTCDEGLCLSLHQPWAQLLVHGIKRIEGRAWSSNHRGRVWIHATSARPEKQTIRELEHFYTEVHGDLKVHFPSDYPTSALVGCVNVVDVLTAEQVGAWEELPGCVKLEVGSPRAFLCEDPRFLARPISMRGHPKLWQLPPQILSRAETCLQLPPQIGPQPFCWMAWHMPPDLKRRQLALNPRRHLFRDKYQHQQPLPGSQGKRELRIGAAEGKLSSPEASPVLKHYADLYLKGATHGRRTAWAAAPPANTAHCPAKEHRVKALVYLWQKAFRIWAVLMCRRRGGLAETMPGSQLTWLRWPTAGKAYRRITSARQLAPTLQQPCCKLPRSMDTPDCNSAVLYPF